MAREEVFEVLTEIFREIFDNDSIEISDSTSTHDIDGWDSLMHITLIGAVEDEFEIRFPMNDIVDMKNVGEMVDLIIKLKD